MEQWIYGSNWWRIQPSTKHLLASQAKALYGEYWDDYFKFSFIRNPWDRAVSKLKYPNYFGVYHDGNFNFDRYQNIFGSEIVLEHDHRFYKREDLISEKHAPGQIYGNILDEKLDFVGRFENLSEDCGRIRRILGINQEFNIHAETSDRKPNYREYYNQESAQFVRRLYEIDIERFDYTY